MTETLADYMAREDWDDKPTETKLNVLATFIIDLENEVHDPEP